jgi:hypothetical protein
MFLHRTIAALVTAACGFLLGGLAGADEPDPGAADVSILRSAKLLTHDSALLDFFRQRTLTDAVRADVQDLIQKLGAKSFTAREKAAAALVQRGVVAVPLLRQASSSPDPEVVRRAAQCLKRIQAQDPGITVAAAVARLLALRKPAGAAEVLLTYLPFEENGPVAEEARTALAAVALRDGRPEEVLVRALTDPLPLKRGAAAEALCRAGAAGQQPAVRKLLKDPDPGVRLRVALGLVEARDKEGLPVLIALLPELPQEQGWQAEDVLFRLAGEQAPAVTLGADAASRRRCRDAWAAWWDKHGAGLDLAKLAEARRLLGYTVMILFDLNNGTGRVLELGTDGKPRWQIEKLQNPMDVNVLPGNRVLIAENGRNRVIECNFKGEVLWEKQVSQPVACQRLADGHTLITTLNNVVEVDRDGKEVFTYRPGDLMAAKKFPDGTLYVLTWEGRLKRLDAAGKELGSAATAPGLRRNIYGGSEIYFDGRVVIPYKDRVAEYNAQGKLVWEARFEEPNCVTRLPNGHTLVATMHSQRVVELDRSGKPVWEYKAGLPAWKARRR